MMLGSRMLTRFYGSLRPRSSAMVQASDILPSRRWRLRRPCSVVSLSVGLKACKKGLCTILRVRKPCCVACPRNYGVSSRTLYYLWVLTTRDKTAASSPVPTPIVLKTGSEDYFNVFQFISTYLLGDESSYLNIVCLKSAELRGGLEVAIESVIWFSGMIRHDLQ